VPIVLKSGSLKLLELSGPVQACNGITLRFYSYYILIGYGHHKQVRDLDHNIAALLVYLAITYSSNGFQIAFPLFEGDIPTRNSEFLGRSDGSVNLVTSKARPKKQSQANVIWRQHTPDVFC